MTRYLFCSHDGFGLGHVRRNTLIAQALIEADPTAEVTVLTGVAIRPQWISDPRIRVVGLPPLLKDSEGAYRSPDMSFEAAVQRRAAVVDRTVDRWRPDVVLVDRHPYGTAGELRPALELARRRGARIVLGLRDVLDVPATVRAEIGGRGWDGVPSVFDEIFVYGAPAICDHAIEYRLPLPPTYCGWVAPPPAPRREEPRLLVVAAGGGGDGADVYTLGLEVVRRLPQHRAIVVAGPYAARPEHELALASRVSLVTNAPGCLDLFTRAESVLQMAGYNSTVEALVAGIRPILLPRRSPRREQAIRASRLATLGLADVVDAGAAADEVAWLVQRRRTVTPAALHEAGISLNGAAVAAELLRSRVAVAA